MDSETRPVIDSIIKLNEEIKEFNLFNLGYYFPFDMLENMKKEIREDMTELLESAKSFLA
jgi:hypothetical protein